MRLMRLVRQHSDAEGDEQRERNRDRDDQRLAPAEHEKEENHDRDRFDEAFHQLVDRQVRLLAIVARERHLDAGRQLRAVNNRMNLSRDLDRVRAGLFCDRDAHRGLRWTARTRSVFALPRAYNPSLRSRPDRARTG